MKHDATEEENVDTGTNVCERATGSCPVGGCGTGKGMCPGIALAIGLVVGTGVSTWLDLDWLATPLTVVVALVFILGFYPGGGRWPLTR